MVGVPGRSKGCNSCRKRKVKCDGQKPFCQRCISSGRQCEGYEKYPTFMIWTQGGYQSRSRLDDMKPASSTGRTPAGSSGSGRSSRASTPRESTAIKPVSPTLLMSEQVAGLYLESICSPLDYYKDDVGTLWLIEAFTTAHGSKPLELATRALASVRVAWARQDEELLRQGKLLYGQALESLQRALYDPRSATDEYTFVAARAMVTYEHYVSTSTDPSSWSSHVQGLTMILRNRGPKPFQTICGRAAMEDVRDTIMIKAYMDRKRSFCLEPDWMTLPWMDIQKDLRQQVCDVGFEIGALFGDLDAACPNGPEQDANIDEIPHLLRRGLDCLSGLEKINLEHADVKGDQNALEFVNVQSAIASLHGWALKLSLTQLFGPILHTLRAYGTDKLTSRTIDDMNTAEQKVNVTTCLQCCRNIMAAARALFTEDMDYAASRRLPFPLLSARYYLTSIKSAELEDCQALYRHFQSSKGVEIVKQLQKGVSPRFDALNEQGPTGLASG